LEATEQERRWGAFLLADRQRGFDLAQAPLLRVALIQCGEECHRLALSFHHLLVDGWCVQRLCQEVLRFEALLRERKVQFPVPPYQEHPMAPAAVSPRRKTIGDAFSKIFRRRPC
jgi:hypothetical protein